MDDTPHPSFSRCGRLYEQWMPLLLQDGVEGLADALLVELPDRGFVLAVRHVCACDLMQDSGCPLPWALRQAVRSRKKELLASMPTLVSVLRSRLTGCYDDCPRAPYAAAVALCILGQKYGGVDHAAQETMQLLAKSCGLSPECSALLRATVDTLPLGLPALAFGETEIILTLRCEAVPGGNNVSCSTISGELVYSAVCPPDTKLERVRMAAAKACCASGMPSHVTFVTVSSRVVFRELDGMLLGDALAAASEPQPPASSVDASAKEDEALNIDVGDVVCYVGEEARVRPRAQGDHVFVLQRGFQGTVTGLGGHPDTLTVRFATKGQSFECHCHLSDLDCDSVFDLYPPCAHLWHSSAFDATPIDGRRF